MSSYPKITFYDISCTITKEPWSPFTTRTYLALRLLEIPFEHQRVQMGRIASLLSAAGVARPPSGRYTLPAITLSPSRTGDDKEEWITESDDIAQVLQQLYLDHGGELSKSLFPDQEKNNRLNDQIKDCVTSAMYSSHERWKSIVAPIYKILEPESQEHFIKTRTEQWGKSPQEIIDTDAKHNEQRDGGIDMLFAKVLEPYSKLYEEKDDKQGLWLGGQRPIYPDLKVLAALQWFKCSNGDAFHKALQHVGGPLEKAWNAGQPLLKE